jgi:hypothetical protein
MTVFYYVVMMGLEYVKCISPEENNVGCKITDTCDKGRIHKCIVFKQSGILTSMQHSKSLY